MGELLTMSQKELDLVALLAKRIDGKILQKQAAESLGLSTRQLRRLEQRYEENGVQGIISKKR